MEEAQAALLQQLGVLVESRQRLTTVALGDYTQEEFVEEAKTYTIGRVQTTVVAGTESFTDNNKGGMIFSATFEMLVDTADLFRHLDNVLAQKQQARADSIAQIEQARADSLERARNISELELAVSERQEVYWCKNKKKKDR
jgi:hypothetical protein